MNNNIISLTGAQGTAKTTLGKALVKEFPGELVYMPSCSRIALADYAADYRLVLEDWNDWSFEHQNSFQLFLANRVSSDMERIYELGQHSKADTLYVFDRSIVDVLAYTKLKYTQDKVSKSVLDSVTAIAIDNIHYIEKLFFFRPDPNYPVERDGIRDHSEYIFADVQFSQVIDYYVSKGIVYTVPNGTLSEKLSFLKETV